MLGYETASIPVGEVNGQTIVMEEDVDMLGERDNTITNGFYLYNDDGVVLLKQINLDTPLKTSLSLYLQLVKQQIQRLLCRHRSPKQTVGYMKIIGS